MKGPSVVIDTNVLISALRSQKGASYRLLGLIGGGRFQVHLSVALILEYEYAARRLVAGDRRREKDVDLILDYICSTASLQAIFFLWRPFLRDPDDDMVLELAISAGCGCIVTHNRRDFAGVREHFGIRVLSPLQFLQEIGEVP